MVELSETRKSHLFYNWLKNGTLKQNLKTFFHQHFQPLYDVMQKESENLEFVQSVIFECKDSLQNSGTKYLLIFDDSCDEVCYSKVFVDFGTAAIQRGMSLFYIKHNLLHQSKLGATLSSKTRTLFPLYFPVLWCQTVCLAHISDSDLSWSTGIEKQHKICTVFDWLTCRHKQTTDHVFVQTPDPFLQNLIFLDWRKQSKFLDDEDTKSLYSPCVPIFSTNAKIFSFSLNAKSFSVFSTIVL